MTNDDPCQEGRCKSAAGSDAGKDQAIYDAPLFLRNPSRNELVCRGIHHGFTDAQRAPHEDEEKNCVRHASWQHRRKRSSKTPDENSDGKNAAGAESNCENAGRQLKDRISDEEG